MAAAIYNRFGGMVLNISIYAPELFVRPGVGTNIPLYEYTAKSRGKTMPNP